MLSQSLLVGLMTMLLAPVSANQAPGKLPPDQPPEFVMVTNVDVVKSTVTLGHLMLTVVNRTTEKEIDENGVKKKIPITTREYVTKLREVKHPLALIRFFDGVGKELSRKQAIKNLRGKMVLLTRNVNQLAPAYRKVLAKDAIVLVVAQR